MEIRIAQTAGFCFGVKNAIKIAEEEAEKNGRKIYTLGPLIHNLDAIRELEAKGVYAAETIEAIPQGEVAVIRAHGVSEKEEKALKEHALTLVDATCPFVKKIHQLVRKEEKRQVIILGDPAHPEVKGICGWCLKEPLIYRSLEEILQDPPGPNQAEGYLLVEQTTFDKAKFDKILAYLEEAQLPLKVERTICSATLRHQEEAAELSKTSDAMIVIGGKHSSNTKKLYDLCLLNCAHTYFVENAAEAREITLEESVLALGITAGASTPDHIIREVAEIFTR